MSLMHFSELILLRLVLLCLLAVVAVPAQAQSQTDDIYQANVRTKLNKEIEYLSAQGYERFGTPDVKAIFRGGVQKVEVDLKSGETYAVIAACDQDCSHVQLSLLDRRGQLIVKSPEAAAVVIVNGSPPDTGTYTLQLDVPGCSSKACSGGIALTRLKAVGSIAPPTDVAPTAEEIARRMQTELKRIGCYTSDVDGRWGHASAEAVKALNRNTKSSLAAETPSMDALLELAAVTVKNCGLKCEDGKIERDGKCVAKPVQRATHQAGIQQKPSSSGSDGSCFNNCIARTRWPPHCAARCAR